MSDAQTCRILVVEDEPVIALIVEDMVHEFGSEIVGPAARITDALVLARDAGIDAAVLDLNVDGAWSYPVADVLKARGIPIIFASGYGPDIVPARYEGCQILQKPFKYQALAEALRKVLAGLPCSSEAA